ncbi:MAG: spore cortex biosynthesis protein YabQ [Clostridia bacterium]
MNNAAEVYIFLSFTVVGIIIACVYDFFRAFRRVKVRSNASVVVQDVVFCIAAGCILTFSIVYFLKEQLRIYIFIGLILGASIYLSTLSGICLKIYIKMLKLYSKITEYIFAPIIFYVEILKIMSAKVKKRAMLSCNMAKNMIAYLYKDKYKFKKKDCLDARERKRKTKVREKKNKEQV